MFAEDGSYKLKILWTCVITLLHVYHRTTESIDLFLTNTKGCNIGVFICFNKIVI